MTEKHFLPCFVGNEWSKVTKTFDEGRENALVPDAINELYQQIPTPLYFDDSYIPVMQCAMFADPKAIPLNSLRNSHTF